MLPSRVTANALLCGLLALCVGFTHASIASVFEPSTPSSTYGNDHGGDEFIRFAVLFAATAAAAAAAAAAVVARPPFLSRVLALPCPTFPRRSYTSPRALPGPRRICALPGGGPFRVIGDRR